MRTMTTAMKNAITASRVELVAFVFIDWPSGPVRAWTGIGPIVGPGGYTYLGVGDFGEINLDSESANVETSACTLTLRGIPSGMLSYLYENYQRRAVTIWIGCLSAGALIADTVERFSGELDIGVINDGPETSSITLRCESEAADLKRPRERRYTHEDQQIDYPGDLGFEFVNALQDKVIIF